MTPSSDAGRITWNDDAVTVTDGDGSAGVFRWAALSGVFAWKVDLGGFDLVCLGCTHDGADELVRMHEDMEGFMDFVEEMQRRCPGYRSDWYTVVAFPAFEENLTLVWRRGEN